jgi:hypothetical protein
MITAGELGEAGSDGFVVLLARGFALFRGELREKRRFAVTRGDGMLHFLPFALLRSKAVAPLAQVWERPA